MPTTLTQRDVEPVVHPLETVVAAAVQAPSIHNTQPWRFAAGGLLLEIRADPTRRLAVADPTGRELVVSCGAAIFTARVAAAHLGYAVRTELLPRADDPELLAALTLDDRRAAGGRPVSEDDAALWAAIPRRHTSRLPFEDAGVPPEVAAALVQAAGREGAVLQVLDPRRAREVLELVSLAERTWVERADYRDELARWIGDDGRRRDGITAHSRGPADATGGVPMRDVSGVYTPSLRPTSAFEAVPLLALLTTGGDEPVDWLRAGQALQAVLLTATSQGLQTSMLSQAVELPRIRPLLLGAGAGADVGAGAGFPQMVLRLGYGRPVAATPRRPVSEVLSVTSRVGQAS